MTALNENLLLNPGAEIGPATTGDDVVPVPDWTITSSFTQVAYANSYFGDGVVEPDDGGTAFFAGGPATALSTATQTVSFSDLSGLVDSGQLVATLSGELGGFSSQDDNMTLTVTFLDVDGQPIGAGFTVQGPFASDRSDVSELLPESGAMAVPEGAVAATVVMTATRDEGSDDDGYADNVSLVLSEAACYLAGTRLATPGGETPAELLRIGDLVLTASGAARRVRWVGRRSYAGRFAAMNPAVQPIRFRAGSLGRGLPRRDLLVSPEHAMFLDGLLIPAKALVNGSTITQERRLDRVDYHHIELDSHDLLRAEGALCESYLEDGNRRQFHNAAGHAATYPDPPAPGGRCAPWVDSGAELEAIRARLADVAGRFVAAA